MREIISPMLWIKRRRNALDLTRPVFRMLLAVLIFVLTACGGAPALSPAAARATAAPTTAAPATPIFPTTTGISTPPPAATALPEALSTGALHDVARERTLVLGWGTQSPIGVTNPWAVPGYTHQEGNNLLWEGLAYYAIFADKEIPWLADRMEYTKPDFTELTINLNTQATWSDGVPLTSNDVVFTFEGQLKNALLPYHTQFEQYVQDVKAIDDQTVVVTFKIPAPRFKFEVLTLKFDTASRLSPRMYSARRPTQTPSQAA